MENPIRNYDVYLFNGVQPKMIRKNIVISDRSFTAKMTSIADNEFGQYRWHWQLDELCEIGTGVKIRAVCLNDR
jgi:hypothetical protein